MAILNPSQIKSATGNTGAFSKDSADIRYSPAAQSSEQDADIEQIFTGLQSRGLKAVRAKEAAAAHPLGEQIQKVHNDFYDILAGLEDAGLIQINC